MKQCFILIVFISMLFSCNSGGEKKLLKPNLQKANAPETGNKAKRTKQVPEIHRQPKDTVSTEIDIKIIGVPALTFSTRCTTSVVKVGDKVTYQVKITNQGTSPADNVYIENIIPEAMEFITAIGPSPFELKDGRVYFESVPLLYPNEELTYQIVCRAVCKNIAILQGQWGRPPISEVVVQVIDTGNC